MFVVGDLVLDHHGPHGPHSTMMDSSNPVETTAPAGGSIKCSERPSPLFVCAALGICESCLLLGYNLVMVLFYGIDELYLKSFNIHGHHTFFVLM